MVRLPAGPATAGYLEWYWAVAWDLPRGEVYAAQVLPFPSINVSFERTPTRTGGFVNGVSTRVYIRELSGRGDTFAAKFRPGAFAACTGIDVSALRDRAVELSEVVPAAAGLTERVLAADTVRGRRDIVEAHFTEIFGEVPLGENYRLVAAIVAAMESEADLTRVDLVCDRFNISIRTLQRLFRRYVGASPKWVLRRFRLQDGAQSLARGRAVDLATLAVELGYFDQAHFAREFAEVIGMTPGEYARTANR
ncbi:MAG: AraC family transcriptional regulator [Nocardia sp.]|nr:AraC family transcriptional regulator [Nocardia sp.]